ncbi:hypothetical protein GALMADRAFT_155529 [Galerina marginata CBS 339.88]|uniref:Uncharacterized protein n=1 Tax=Galerina marginata (strain CBS 339.88) TaxID=685588 RepID=A0A067TCW3_GALM3|nr:hypothetical protein GALMADRAFT_155529 [Galerina marginata CBS 339.88]
MSAILPAQKRLTTSVNFSKVPGVQAWGVPDLIPAAHSGGAPSVSSTASATYCNTIGPDEPCCITKSSCYTHKILHWVNAARNDPDVKKKVEDLLRGRGIVYSNFTLDSIVNLSHLDRVLHAALEEYAFIAITGSHDTLRELISMLKTDNDRRQTHFDANCVDICRIIDFEAPAFSNPQYELVALRPKHLLPNGKVLITYSRDSDGLVALKTYVPGEDHTLRESPGTLSSPRFPPFSFDHPRPNYANPNPFLVILNAEIKFRRYLRQQQPPPLPLSADIMTLIHLTTELVELIYWDPIIRPDTPAAQIFLNTAPSPREDYVDDGGDEEEWEVPPF